MVDHENTSKMRKGFIGRYVLLEVIYFMMACLTGGHVLQEYM